MEVNKRLQQLKCPLQEIVARTKCKYSMKGGNATSASWKIEKVSVSVLREAVISGLGELLFENRKVGVKPWTCLLDAWKSWDTLGRTTCSPCWNYALSRRERPQYKTKCRTIDRTHSWERPSRLGTRVSVICYKSKYVAANLLAGRRKIATGTPSLVGVAFSFTLYFRN